MTTLVYLMEKEKAKKVGRLLDKQFDQDTLTGFGFFLTKEGQVYVTATFSEKASPAQVESARALLDRRGSPSELTPSDLITRMAHGEFPIAHMGDGSIFLYDHI